MRARGAEQRRELRGGAADMRPRSSGACASAGWGHTHTQTPAAERVCLLGCSRKTVVYLEMLVEYDARHHKGRQQRGGAEQAGNDARRLWRRDRAPKTSRKLSRRSGVAPCTRQEQARYARRPYAS